MWIDDDVLSRCAEPSAIAVWVPERPLVVLGSGNDASREVYEEHCQQDGVPILRRYGGGGTVVLHEQCVVVSIGIWVEHPFRNDHYFTRLNAVVIDALSQAWPILANLGQQGISDLAFGERKVAGTSLFRSRNYLLYQASLLVDVNLPVINRYLRHPSREPSYRAGRPHASFLLGLADIVPGLSAFSVKQALDDHLETACTQLAAELISPQPLQIPHIRRRAGLVD